MSTSYSIGLMEPMFTKEGDRVIEDLAFELIEKSSYLISQLNPIVRESIGDLVRSMNCYYSNLIEGHNTHPRDIDRALRKDYSTDTKKRALQLEAKAHIEVQKMTDEREDLENVASMNFITWLHREFCTRLPEELLIVTSPERKTTKIIIPGEFRDGDVQVGEHIPPPADSIIRFMNRFTESYDPKNLSRVKQIIAIAVAHHRLLWIHPFYDGNGRVTRLFSHAYLKHVGVGNSIWSVSRGLARNVSEYKTFLANADKTRKGDLDGRGSLTLEGLTEFVVFFLKTCIDQVKYMISILEPASLASRIQEYLERKAGLGTLSHPAFLILREALLTGEVERGRASAITGYKDRQARTVLSTLLEKKLLYSETPRGAVKIGFPLEVLEYWFPRIYPADVVM